MGTRSLITFIDNDEPLVTVYRQFDGYPGGRGRELAQFLDGIVMRNGFGIDDEIFKHANGMGCLAAQWIKYEKEDIGGVYIYPPTLDPGEDGWEEYLYTVEDDGNGIVMTASELPLPSEPMGGQVFRGAPSGYVNWLEAWIKEREEA